MWSNHDAFRPGSPMKIISWPLIIVLVNCEKNPLSGERIQIDSNGIPDHSAWALTGSTSTITEQSNSFRVPTVPVLLSIEAGIPKV